MADEEKREEVPPVIFVHPQPAEATGGASDQGKQEDDNG